MAYTIHYADCGYCSSDYGKNAQSQIVERCVFSFVDDIDWLNFSVK